MFRFTATACFAVLCVLVARARASDSGLPGPVVPSGFGVNIHFTDPQPSEMERLAEAGYRLARMDLAWGSIERDRGVYDFKAYDRLVAHLAKAGARPLFILDYGNRLYDDGQSPQSEAGRAAFAKFAAAAAGHFRGKGVIWEIWNEPNLAQFWKPAPNADDYAKLAMATAKAVHEADPDAVVLAPGSSGFPWEFFETIFRAGLLAHIDAVSVHPYRGGPPESAAEDFGKLRALVARYAPADKRDMPIVSSEWGYSTVQGGISEAQQAHYLTRMWLANLAAGVNLSIFYDWRDDGDNPKENEHRFGTVRRDFKPKPSFLAAKSLIAALNGFAFRHRLRGGTEDEWNLLFERGEGEELALVTWRTGSKATEKEQAPAVRKLGRNDRHFAAYLRLAAVRYHAGALTETTGRAAELEVTVANKMHPGATVTIVAGDTSTRIPASNDRDVTRRVTLPLPDEREEKREAPFKILAGELTWELAPLTIWRVDPLRLSAEPRGGELVANVEDPARVAFHGTLAIEAEGPATTPAEIVIPEGTERQTVTLVRLKAAHRLVLKDDADKTVASLSRRRYEPMPGFPAKANGNSGYELVLFVENKPTPGEPLAAVATQQDAPQPVALSVRYHFDRGWRYAEAVPPAPGRIPPGARALTFWARSTNKADHLRSRFRDNTGQTFQVDLGQLGGEGWRAFTIPLDGSHVGSHWGGAGDGVPHPPLAWESLVLVDSGQRETAHDGEVLIASPFYVFAK